MGGVGILGYGEGGVIPAILGYRGGGVLGYRGRGGVPIIRISMSTSVSRSSVS